jgi:acyl carrier protein
MRRRRGIVQVTGVRLAHASPGRLRLKVDDVKNDAQRARQLEDQLRTVPGIHSVEASPVTGSLLLTYDEPALDSLDSMEVPFSTAKALGISLNDLDPEDLRLLMSHHGNGSNTPNASISEGLEAAVKEVNATLRRAVGADLGILLPLTLALLGIRSLMRTEKTVLPPWHDYLWFSFSTYFILNQTPSAPE